MMKLLFSDRSASPSGDLWLLAPALLRFLSSAARFSPSAAVPPNSFEGYVSFQAACTSSLSNWLSYNLVAQFVGNGKAQARIEE